MNFLLTILFSLSLSTGLTISNSEESIRAELISSPPPQYPVHVRVDGWVLLKYDISEDGIPVNIIILDAGPKHLFGRSAKRALSKWRYKPASQNGNARIQLDNEITIEFKLE